MLTPPGLQGHMSAAPSNMPAGQATTLDDLLRAIQRNEEGGEKRNRELRQDMFRLDKDIREVRTTASKALTQTTEVRDDVKALEGRVWFCRKLGTSRDRGSRSLDEIPKC